MSTKLEMTAYQFLKERQIPFTRQPEYVLEEGFMHNGKKQRPIKYVADFLIEKDGQKLVIDIKGVETPVSKLKKKLMLSRHGVEVHCIKKSGSTCSAFGRARRIEARQLTASAYVVYSHLS